MKIYTMLYTALIGLLVIFPTVYGMDPKNPFLDLFDEANNYIIESITLKHSISAPDNRQSNILTIIPKISNHINELIGSEFNIDDFMQIEKQRNSGIIESNNFSPFEKLKKASITAYLAAEPMQLCKILNNTFNGLDCKKQMYTNENKT